MHESKHMVSIPLESHSVYKFSLRCDSCDGCVHNEVFLNINYTEHGCVANSNTDNTECRKKCVYVFRYNLTSNSVIRMMSIHRSNIMHSCCRDADDCIVERHVKRLIRPIGIINNYCSKKNMRKCCDNYSHCMKQIILSKILSKNSNVHDHSGNENEKKKIMFIII